MATLPPCILFDLDGTIVDSLPGIEFSIREAFIACKLTVPGRNLRELIGPPIRAILADAGNILDQSQLSALENAFRLSYDSEGWRKTVCYPDADLAIRSLREHGHRLFIISNKPRHVSLRILEGHGILDCFDAIITRDSRSPAYATKMEMIGSLLSGKLQPQDCAIVGDTIEDANAAAQAGIPFILMAHGYGRLSEISSLPVAHILNGFSQFCELVTKEPVLD